MQWFFLIERQIYIKLSSGRWKREMILENEKYFPRNMKNEKMLRFDLYLNKFEYKENLIDKFI